MSTIAVVGAGCIGLAAGIQLLQAGYNVTIITKAVTPNITSDGAGALWRPFGHSIQHQQRVFERWSAPTFHHLLALYQQYGTIQSGIVPVSGFQVSRTTELNNVYDIPYWSKVVTGFRILTKYELERFFPLPTNKSQVDITTHTKPTSYDQLEDTSIESVYHSGYFFTSMAADMSTYLACLTREFEYLGGKIVIGEISSFKMPFSADQQISDLLKSALIIINCTGMASRELCNDLSVRPARGYVLRVHAPHVHHFVMEDEHMAYIFPRNETVVLGGTYNLDSWDTSFNEATRDDIRARCKPMIPNIENAPIVNEWVGLRPTRPWVRLELEYPDGKIDSLNSMTSSSSSSSSSSTFHAFTKEEPTEPQVPPSGCHVPLVHCYGHGGSGVTLHWGCAMDIVKLVIKVHPPTYNVFATSSSSIISPRKLSALHPFKQPKVDICATKLQAKL